MQISGTHDQEVEELVRAGVLQEVRLDALPLHALYTNGSNHEIRLWVGGCCDGHQMKHIFSAVVSYFEKKREMHGFAPCTEDCFHWKTVHGGGAMLSPELPLTTRLRSVEDDDGTPFDDRIDLHLLANFRESVGIKKMTLAVLIAHAVCAKLKGDCPSIFDYCKHIVLSKRRLMQREGLRKDQVVPLFQVHRADGERVVYHVDSALVLGRLESKSQERILAGATA